MSTSVVRRARAAAFAIVCGLALAAPAGASDLQFAFLRDDISPAPAGSDPTPAGGVIIYDVRIENSAADTVADVRTIFDVPAGTSAINLPAFCTLGGSRIECQHGTLVGTLPPAGGVAVDFQLQFQTSVAGAVTFDGAIGVGAPPAAALPLPANDPFFAGEANTSNNAAQQITTIVAGGDLSISKSANPDPVVGGANVTYTVTVSNLGPNDSTGVRVVDSLPAATSLVAGSASGAGWSFSSSGSTLTATRATALANGASAQFTFQAKVNAGSGTITNGATVDTTGAGATPDPTPGNNTATVDTTVLPGADLSVGKAVTPNPAVAGDVITFTLTPRNLGPSTALDAVLLDNLPAGFTLAAIVASPNWLCTGNPGDSSLNCTRASFPVGATDNIVFTANTPLTVPGAGLATSNSATISAGTADPIAGNNTGSVNFTVLANGADLQLLSKTKGPGIVPVWDGIGPDTASRMVTAITVRNNGPQAVSGNLQVNDTLAAGEEFVSASGPWTCTANGTPPTQSVTCTFNGPYPVNVNQTLSGGNVLFLTTRAIAAGTLTNTACTGGSGGSAEPDTAGGVNDDPRADNDCTGASARATVESADLVLSKTTSTPAGGDKVVSTSENSVTYTLVIGNNGANPTGGIVLDDPIPGFISGRTPVPSVIAPAEFLCTPAATVRCTSNAGFQLAPGDTRTISITVNRPLNDSSASNVTCNGASVSNAFCNSADVHIDPTSPDAVGESDTGNNVAQDFVQIDRVANVQTTAKTILSGTPGRAGVDTQYRIDYRNDGPSAVPGVVFSDVFTIPADDTGFVVVSATRTPGTVACTVTPGAGITTSATAGGTSYSNAGSPVPGNITVTCPALNLANQQVEAMLLTIRPNFASGPGVRQFDNTATFSISGGASGSDALGSFAFNTDASAADDEKSAMLPFDAGQVDLITNKTDIVDPIGFDPFDFTLNDITYRVTVRNQGPSVATGVHVTDVLAPPAGKTVRFLGDSTSSSGPFALNACTITAGSNPVTGPATLSLDCMMPGVGFSPNVTGIIGNGTTSELFLRVQYESAPDAGGDTLNDTATAIANETDTNNLNDSDGETTTIRARADLALSKLATNVLPDSDPNVAAPASVASVTLFEPHWWVLDAVNNGPGASLSIDRSAAAQLNGTGTVIVDTLPAGTVLNGSATWQKSGPALAGATPDGSGSCALSGVTLTCNVGDVSPGGRVRILVPVRWTTFPAGGSVTNNAVVNTEQVDPIPGNNSATANLLVTRSSLTGIVFQDRDRAGGNGGTPQAAATEPRINGVQIRLSGTDLYGNVVNRTANSNASGVYTFSNLAPADASGYTLTQTQPAGFVNGPIDPPNAGGAAPTLGGVYAASINAGGDSQYSTIAVGGNDVGSNYNFPEVRLPSLSGFVYLDVNGNGVRDAGSDQAIAGATVRLLEAATGNLVSSAVSDGTGAWSFAALDPFTVYTVEEPLPASPTGIVNGPVNPGLINALACASGCTAQANTPAADTDRIADIDLGAGADGTVFNFGEIQLADIAGVVYVDADRNNALDGTDTARIANVVVRLVQGADCATGSELASTITDAGGAFAFAGQLAFRDYLLCETQPLGYGNGNANGTPGSDQATIVNLPAAGSTNNTFGEVLASIAGSVYIDQNQNGTRDAGELGIDNVQVSLTGTDVLGNPVNRNLNTDLNGDYLFADLLAPNGAGYLVSEGAIPPAAGVFNDGLDALGNATAPGTLGNDVLSAIGPAPGQQASGYLFGEFQATAISGVVYVDADRNNALDPGDTLRIAGVTVRLLEGASCATGVPVASTSTNTAGAYQFLSVTVGRDYAICEDQPAGYGNGNALGVPGSDEILIANLPLLGVAGNNFGELVGALSGRVFLDRDNNGAQGAGDAGIGGVQVSLSGIDARGNAVNRSVTSDANGDFRFDDLLGSGAAGYTLGEQPAQPVVLIAGSPLTTLNGQTRAGTIGASVAGVATAVTVLPSAVQGIALPAGASGQNYLFAETLPTAISGVVFLDVGNDGAQNDPADVGLAAVAIELTGTDDLGQAVSLSQSSDADGRFAFAGLRPGVYTLTEPSQPLNTVNGITTPGSGGGSATDVAIVPSAIAAIDLRQPGARADANLFAEVPASGLIAGKVWLDRDNDGVIDADELGIADVAIELRGTDLGSNAISRDGVTDAEGNFRFTDLPPGRYTLSEPQQPADTLNGQTIPGSGGGTATPPAVTPSVITDIDLGANAQAIDNNFGELPPAAIAGRVWADDNDNGTPDAGETGLAGVDIVLSGSDDLGVTINLTAVTDVDGRYRFDGLRPGTYTVSEPQQPIGTLNGITVPGQISGVSIGVATDVATTPSAISAIVLNAGDESLENDFGEIPDSPDLKVSKQHGPQRFSVNNPGRYTIFVRNAGSSASSGEYEVRDRLPAGIVLRATPQGNGWSCDGAAGASGFTCRSAQVLAPGQIAADPISVEVDVSAAALAASPANNAVLIEGGGEIDARRPTPDERAAFAGDVTLLPVCDPGIVHEACRDPVQVQQSSALSGSVWYDLGSNPLLRDGGDQPLPGWIVEVIDPASGQVIASQQTAGDGRYRIVDLPSGTPLQVRFRDPDSAVVWGLPVNGETVPDSPAACDPEGAIAGGFESSCVETGNMGGASTTLGVVLAPGDELVEQSLPIIPGGVVYDAIARTPVPGAVVSLQPVGTCAGYDPERDILNARSGGYSIDGDAIAMTVGDLGLYRFLFAAHAPTCTFQLTVTAPQGFSFVSQLIAPQTGVLDPGGDAGARFDVQPQGAPPQAAVGPGTRYALQIVGGASKAAIVHNHIPLDPATPAGLAISKVADKQIAEVGDAVLYTVLVRQTGGSALPQVSVLDRLPAGFTYIAGSAAVNGHNIADPIGAPGPSLAFALGAIASNGQLTLNYRLRVGVGSQQGDGINRAQAFACGLAQGCIDPDTLAPFPAVIGSNEARYRVRVTGGVFTNEACVLGKVYVDCNGNQMQDREELGIPGVRFYFEDGTWLVSDSEGKYSYCGLTPQSHVLKADASTLPRGSRLVTSSNRNLGDAGSLFLDLKNGELHRADFIEGSCSNPVIEQVKARRTQGEVSVPESETGQAPLRFESKPARAPRQATDSAKQAPIVAPRGSPPPAVQGDRQGGAQ